MQENNLSSHSVTKIDDSAPKEAALDLPKTYGKTEAFLLPKDPAWMFIFWEITPADFQRVMDARGGDIFAASKSVIRVYDITGVSFDGQNANSHFDVPMFFEAGSWYITAAAGRSYCCDIGIITPQGDFVQLTRSNGVKLPTGKVSAQTGNKWMLVEGDYQKLLHMAGGDIYGVPGAEGFGPGGPGGPASEKLQHIWAHRWHMFDVGSSPSLHTSAAFVKKEDK